MIYLLPDLKKGSQPGMQIPTPDETLKPRPTESMNDWVGPPSLSLSSSSLLNPPSLTSSKDLEESKPLLKPLE